MIKSLFIIKKIGNLAERREATFSECGRYRYLLRIVWDEKLPLCQFIGLNPSTADEMKDDPTVRRCKDFARRWGCGGLLMTNVFAFRATKPTAMMRQASPVGPGNADFILAAASQAQIIVAAWGNDGAHMQQGFATAYMLKQARHRLQCFKKTGLGEPIHPLYQRADQPLQPL